METFKIVVEVNADYESMKAWNRAMIDLIDKKAIKNPTTGNWFTLGVDLLKQRIFREKMAKKIFKDRKWLPLDETISESKGE